MLMASTTPGRWWVTSGTAGALIHAFITGPDGAGMMDLNSLVDLPGGVILNSHRHQ